MAEQFKSKRFFNNIEFLIKASNKKIGEVEAESGVSAGYISRTNKDGGSKPGIDFVVNVANALGVSIDTLVKIDLGALTPTEQYLLSFLEKLETETHGDLLEWERETADNLNNLDTDINNNVGHPLFSYRSFYEPNDNGEPVEVSRVIFESRTFGVHTAIHDDCFSVRLKNNSYLYLMNISKSCYRINDPDAFATEVWMTVQGCGEPQFLCSNQNGSKLAVAVDDLYALVAENMKHPQVKKEVRYIIDSFMKGDKEDDPQPDYSNEEIPF